MDCRNKSYIGKSLPEEWAKAISKSLKGKVPKNHWQSGDKHPFWNPERTDRRDRNLKEYQQWRYAVIKRDKYTCQICGAKRSSKRKFHVDHIEAWAMNTKLRFDIKNGRVLCDKCHHKTDTWGKQRKRYAKFIQKEAEWEAVTPVISSVLPIQSPESPVIENAST